MLKMNQSANELFLQTIGDNESVFHHVTAMEHRLTRIAAELATNRYEGQENWAITEVWKLTKPGSTFNDQTEVFLQYQHPDDPVGVYEYAVQLSVDEWRAAMIAIINQ